MKSIFYSFTLILLSSVIGHAQIIPNGTIDNLDELIRTETIYIPMEDGVSLATDISYPITQDSIVTELTIAGQTSLLQIIPKNTQYIIYDTNNININSFKLPIVLSRTPYNKASDAGGRVFFPFLGYIYANQDMRGRYESEGVYFPMYSDAWPKESYHPNITIPMDLFSTNSPSNALKHHDGSQTINYLAYQAKRILDINHDGITDTLLYSNGKIGMFGASALGNSQYQAISDFPFTQANPLSCLMPIVATNEHYNTTLFHNGVFRNALVRGWTTGQMMDMHPSLDAIDGSLSNNIHSTSDYGYSDSMALAKDLIDWQVTQNFGSSPSGAFPNSKLRSDLDASQAPINAQGISDINGNISRYKNVNKPAYHLTGWWDIFINGQIETFNRTKKANPGVKQKLVIGPWTHQTIGSNHVGNVIYPNNVYDLLKIEVEITESNTLTDSSLFNKIYQSEVLSWFRSNLGGEPYFFIPESQQWQTLGNGQIRIPSKNYFAPYFNFISYLGGVGTLPQIPVEINAGGGSTNLNLDFPTITTPLFSLQEPITPPNPNQFEQVKDIRLYMVGPTNDPQNQQVGNYWLGLDKFPLETGTIPHRFYLHQNQSVNTQPPSVSEGTLYYTADPNNPVLTIGGNNMIPTLPDGSGNSQGQIDLSNPNWNTLTMDRGDVLQFTSSPLSDTLSVLGFPKAAIYAKGKTSTYNTAKTDFDVMIRVLDVFPDGREMFVTEGVVNAKARAYAKALSQGIDSTTIAFSNIDNDAYSYFEFQLLPLGYTFGKGHQVKILLSSSNYPKYQSNPHLPNEVGEFFRWNPGDQSTYNYQGQNLQAQSAEITYSFDSSFPSYIEFPALDTIFPTVINPVVSQQNSFKIYPNPTHESVSITWSKVVAGELVITNTTGEIMIRREIKKGEQTKTILLSGIKPGVYFVHISGIDAV